MTNPSVHALSFRSCRTVSRCILPVVGLLGCGASSGDGDKRAVAPSSAPVVSVAAPREPVGPSTATPDAPAPACRPRVVAPNDTMEQLAQNVKQPYGKNVIIEYSGTVETNGSLWRLLPTLSETGHITSIAPTFTDGPHGPIFGAFVEKPERQANGAATTSLHFGLATAACAGGEHAWLGPLVPFGRERHGAVTLVDTIRLSGQPTLTGLRVVVDAAPITGFDPIGSTTEVFELLVGKGRPGLPVLEPKGAEIGILGRVSNLAGQVAPVAGANGDEPLHDVLLSGSGFYPLGQGAAMLVYHRRGPKERREPERNAPNKPSAAPAFFPPSFRLAARIDEQGLTTDPARLGVAYVIAIATNQPPAEVCDKPIEGASFVCRAAHTHLERYIDGAEAQWFVGLFPDPVSAQKVMNTYHIKGKIYATEPPPGGAPPALLDGKPVPWVLEGRPPKPQKPLWGF